jgi:hypothetical protein
LTPRYFESKNSSIYFNTLISGVVGKNNFFFLIYEPKKCMHTELPGFLLTMLSFRFFNEKAVLFVQLFFTGVFTILLGIEKAPFIALFIFALAARSFIAGANASTYVVTVSVYPTILRSTGFGLCSALGLILFQIFDFILFF